MREKELEFRGIPLDHLMMYLEEIGGTRLTNTFPYRYDGEGWQAVMIEEREIAFTAVFIVNAVTIRFRAEDEKRLAEVLKEFRVKTLRAGG